MIAKGSQERSYSAGTTLFAQGDASVDLYVIKTGQVRIIQARDPDRAEEVPATPGTGDVLGEMALLDDLPRSATAEAIEDTTVLLLPVWEFREILRRYPDIAVKLLGVLSRRLRKAEASHRD